jgi:uncharacterized protein (TIGR03435 family)
MANRFARDSELAGLVFWPTMVAAVLMAPCAYAQSLNGQSTAFEVASIRPSVEQQAAGEGSSRSQLQFTADGLTMRNIDLSEMVEWAYGLEHYQLQGSGMLDGQRYDVRAKAGGPVPLGTLRLMLQNLLTTRFKVQLHHEQKTTSVYELRVAKGGPRLPHNKADTLPSSYPRERFPRVVEGGFLFSNVSMTEFAQQLTELRGIELPVVDRTGIQGIYDITLKSAASAILDPDGPSLLTLIQEQIGLKLVSAKDPVDVLVVDHAEKPSAN